MRTPLQRSVLSQSLSSLYCRICMGDQRRFLSWLFNRYNNVMNYYPSSGNRLSFTPSWVSGPSVNTDPRGGPVLPDHPSFAARRRSVNASYGNIIAPPGLSTIRHPGCWKGNVSLKSGQHVAVCPGRPHEKQINPVMFRRCCRSRGGCRCRGRRPSHNDSNDCSGLFGTDSLNNCCNRSSIS